VADIGLAPLFSHGVAPPQPDDSFCYDATARLRGLQFDAFLHRRHGLRLVSPSRRQPVALTRDPGAMPAREFLAYHTEVKFR
jgi:hypothetical protein